jgi:predicted GNAT family N-acyltransferase
MKTIFKEINYGGPEWTSAVKLRESILREPLGSWFTNEELAEEKDHFQIAGFLDHSIVATAVLVPEGNRMKMQRVVVKEDLRNLNIGSEMMRFCEQFGSDKHVAEMYCHARDTAVNFYLKNGYEGEGDYFDEDGIPHLKMSKKL